MAQSSDGYKIIADNRKARFEYEILETFEAGIELKGTEVKSIRAGRVNLGDGFANLRNGEVILMNVHVSPHNTTSNYFNQLSCIANKSVNYDPCKILATGFGGDQVAN